MTDDATRSPPWFARPIGTWVWLSYWALLCAATHSPQPGWPGWAPEPSDKTLHLVTYFGLGLLGWLVLSAGKNGVTWRPFEWFSLVVVYGAADEVIQTICRRYCSPSDLIADAIGAALAIAAVEVYRRFRRGPAPRNATCPKVGH